MAYDLWGGFSGTTCHELSSVFMKYSAGVQYAEWSCFTPQLTHLDFNRSSAVEVKLKADHRI